MKTQHHTLDDSSGGAALLLRIAALLFFVTIVLAPSPVMTQTTPSGPAVLVLYDNDTQWGWLGEIYSVKLENLLAHFDARVTRLPMASYTAGKLAAHDACFYIGAVWNETPLAAAFQADLEATTKPFVWMGVNLWRYAWDLSTYGPRQAFTDRYGFELLAYSSDNHPTVVYKDTNLLKEPFDQGLSRTRITDPAKARSLATCLDESGTAWPYIIRSGNFWFVADMPMVSTTFENRSLAFADLMHDMLGIDHPELHRAYFRIEDVSPEADVTMLALLGDTLAPMNIPFTISLIPEYRDWKGTYNGGVPETYRVTKGSPFTREIQRWVAEGAQILQHGTSHQIDGLLNPYTGVTGDDYEFYRVTADAAGNLTLVGPTSGDSPTSARSRVVRGRSILRNAGCAPAGWLTPHYLASPVDYKVFAGLFPFACDRAIFFIKDSTGKNQATELNAPFPYRDIYGLKRIPETIGYIDPLGWYDLQPPTTPQDLVRRARALKVVRDGWAGFYFHWYIDPALLKETVTGLKQIGYQFVPLSSGLR